MRMRIAVTSSGPSPEDAFDSRFGRAPFILVYDTGGDVWEVIDNSPNCTAQSGAGIGAADLVARAEVDVVMTGYLGPKAEQALAATQVRSRLGEFESPRLAVEQLRIEWSAA
jgi:predicted Fe-Mo cluster-binding NifX family protein